MRINPKLIASDNYSTTETKIGTWLGKPLYRKVYSFNVSSNGVSSVDLDNISYDKIWLNMGKSFVQSSTRSQGFARADYRDTIHDVGFFIAIDTKRLTVVSGSNAVAGTAYATVEYTKTTD
jgi:hypothetical protein